VFRLAEHLERLFASAHVSCIDIPFGHHSKDPTSVHDAGSPPWRRRAALAVSFIEISTCVL